MIHLNWHKSTFAILICSSVSPPIGFKGFQSTQSSRVNPSDPDLLSRARAARKTLGSDALILGHHYQRNEVIEFADITGDSFKLAQEAANQSSVENIIFCGVHFMAESADILTSERQKIILPDLAAGDS